jgi:predicted NBD/HSP70 family sugar kinase
MEFNPSIASDPLLYLSMNHGVGAGVIFNDRLLTGRRGFAGEVGHMVLQINGPLCSCGRRGCAEALIGARSMLGTDEEHPHPLREIRRLVQERHPETLRAVRKAGGYLGVLLQNLASAYDPGSIVIGGQMADLGDVLLQPALRTLTDYAAAANLPPPNVRSSRFGRDAVPVGAAALVRYRLTRPLMGSLDAEGSLDKAA